MGILSIVIKKVAEQASKVVLFGALVGGVSLVSYATETTVGPTIEKAQLETVDINLDAVVAAITKADPDWVKGLPKVGKAKKERRAAAQWFTYQLDPGHLDFEDDKFEPMNYVATGITNPSTRPCDSNGKFCSIYAETVELSGTDRPDISPLTNIYDALDNYENGDGEQTLIDEESN